MARKTGGGRSDREPAQPEQDPYKRDHRATAECMYPVLEKQKREVKPNFRGLNIPVL